MAMKFNSVDEAVTALTGADPDARKAAADYLGERGDSHSVAALVAALDDDRADVQINAAEALGASGQASVVDVLADVLRNPTAALPVRQTAARSLGVLGQPEAVPVLVGAIQPVFEDPEHTDHNVVRAAGKSLGDLGPMLLDDAARAEVVETLIELADAHSTILRQVAITGLGQMVDPRTVPILIDALQDKSWLVRQAAVRALGETGGEGARRALEGMLSDPNRNVSIAAADALEQLT